MQAEEKGTDTGSNKTQVNEPSRPNKEHISGGKNSGEENSEREMSGNSHESHEERGHKPAGNMVHEIHAGDQEQHAGKKPGHEQHAEEKTQNHEQHEGMKHEGHEQHEGMKHEQHEEMKHEQHEEMKHQGHETSGGKRSRQSSFSYACRFQKKIYCFFHIDIPGFTAFSYDPEFFRL